LIFFSFFDDFFLFSQTSLLPSSARKCFRDQLRFTFFWNGRVTERKSCEASNSQTCSLVFLRTCFFSRRFFFFFFFSPVLIFFYFL